MLETVQQLVAFPLIIYSRTVYLDLENDLKGHSCLSHSGSESPESRIELYIFFGKIYS